MGEFDGIRVLVTGGASGIGFAVARRLADDGGSVAILDRVDAASAKFSFVTADVTDDLQVREAVLRAATGLGGLDVLVNNVGIGAQGGIGDNADDEWKLVFDVNVLGAVRVSRAALPWLVQSKNAAIVNVCSVAASLGLTNRAVYAASKGALLSLTRAMAADLIEWGIRVNAVNPGTTDTPWIDRLLEVTPHPTAERAALEARQPHGRLVSAEEVAGAVAYLASPRAGSTTGTSLAVDGGMSSFLRRLP